MVQGRVLPAVVVLTVVVVSGLLGAGGAAYPGADGPRPGDGNASVDVVSTPETVTLERTRFGAGTFRPTATPAVVDVQSVRGNPELTYTLDIPNLSFSDVAHYPLAGRSGRVEVRFNPVELSPALVERSRYRATVGIWLRSGDRYVNLHQSRVPVEVDDG